MIRWDPEKSAWLKRERGVSYVLSGDEVFLKTLFPSRKYTRLVREGKLP